MIKYYCDKCGKEVERYIELQMSFNRTYKTVDEVSSFNCVKTLNNNVILCNSCYQETIKELNKVLVNVKAKIKFIEEA